MLKLKAITEERLGAFANFIGACGKVYLYYNDRKL